MKLTLQIKKYFKIYMTRYNSKIKNYKMIEKTFIVT